MSISQRMADNTAALTSLEQAVQTAIPDAAALTALTARVSDLETTTVTDAELATQLGNYSTTAEMNAAIAASGGSGGSGDPGGGDPGGGSSATADAVIAGFAGTYDTARQAAITTMITSIEGAGIGDIWAKIKVLLMFASPSSVDAMMNWKTGVPATLVGSGINTPDQGFQVATGHVLTTYALQESDHSNFTFMYWGANGGPGASDSFPLFANYETSINIRMAVVDGSTDLAFDTSAGSLRTYPRLPGMTLPPTGQPALAFTGGSSYIAVAAAYNGSALTTYSRGVFAQTLAHAPGPAYDFSAIAENDRKLQLLGPQSNGVIQDPDNFCVIIADLLSQEEITAVHNAVDAYLTSIGAIT